MFDIAPFLDTVGEPQAAALFGLVTGLVFGVAAQRSRFCLRASAIEFAHGHLGPRMAVWLLTFSTALVWVQAARMAGLVDAENARMMAIPGSWSGAIVGGLLFGAGMVLARGCSGRLLVLAATGNLRSVVSGLIFAVVAQMSLAGALSPTRSWLAGLWITEGGQNVNYVTSVGLPQEVALIGGLLLALAAILIARRAELGASRLIFGSGVGFAIALGWVLTTALSQAAFDPVQIESATFSGPSANTLMFFLDRDALVDFDIGIIAGVVIGAFAASLWGREFSFQGFEGHRPMREAMIGAALMGFGAMLAGGCAIGAGVTGTSILVGTALVALTAMWIGAIATERLLQTAGPEKSALPA
ncbi:MAG: YeeE/YedE family protein [Sulfitobacter sp.]|nr:YeeE/YedE family protein [Sulfitobacter sp.]